MKKKSLLIAMAAMSVAAIGAGTVSTMAWFSATSAGATMSADTTGNNLTVHGDYASTGNVNAVVNITAPSSEATLDLSDDDGNTKALVSDTPTPYTNELSETYVQVTYTLSFTDNSTSVSFADKMASLAAQSKVITLTASGIIKAANGTDTDANATTALKFKKSAAPSRTGTDGWKDEATSGSLVLGTYTITGSETAGSAVSLDEGGALTFYVGIDGENEYAVDAIKNRGIVISVTPSIN